MLYDEYVTLTSLVRIVTTQCVLVFVRLPAMEKCDSVGFQNFSLFLVRRPISYGTADQLPVHQWRNP